MLKYRLEMALNACKFIGSVFKEKDKTIMEGQDPWSICALRSSGSGSIVNGYSSEWLINIHI